MFEIGIIVKPQGIRGELRVLPTTDDPARFGLLNEVFVRREKGEPQKYALTSARQQKGLVMLTLEGVNDRNAAEALVGAVLVIPDTWALPLDEDEYFVRDLIGLTAVDEKGEALGEVADVLRTGANDVYVIRPTQGASFMVPAIKDVVRGVDMNAGCITLRLMDGLRELKA
ncbi:MAG: ribosome maturation factor RimM [Defluviitaleaceae bacterium]|nr:ribosome maturation factor RimM [Defluviitaleaceae bacterium]MCL2275197.1 ribosome maturation factor RimM [Defluviitaleaceae bacterium]